MVCDKDQNRVSFYEDWEFYKAPFGSERRVAQIVYPKNADSYEERTFALQDVTGKKKVSFAFLPGSNFDFSYFRFEKQAKERTNDYNSFMGCGWNPVGFPGSRKGSYPKLI